MIPVPEAEQIILNLAQPLDALQAQETVSLLQANQRILATDITGPRDFPYWDNSAMDGYAVRHTDLQHCTPDHPTRLTIVTEIPAGTPPQQPIGPGEAARIFTGAMMPPGADTVIMQEDTTRDGSQVVIRACPQPQAYVRHQGDYYRADTPLLAAGTVLGAADLAVLATVQCTQIPVFRQPRVALLSTGNELIAPEDTLAPGQIIDSNRYALAALVQQTGGIVCQMENIGDRPADLKRTIAQACQTADMVISTGGVSVGDYDYVESTLTELGGTLHLQAVSIKPGKPLTVASLPAPDHKPTLYFGLPGNPASALVCFWRFVQPALRKLAGQRHPWGPMFVTARTQQDLQAGGRRETYLWGQLTLSQGSYQFTPATGSHSSANLMNLAQTNGLAILPCGRTHIAAGGHVQVMQVAFP